MTRPPAPPAPPHRAATPAAAPSGGTARSWRPAAAVLAITPLLRYAVARHAVPPGTGRRTGCDACGAPIGPHRPWPALGPTARCGGCGTRVGAPPATVELAALAAVAALLLTHPPAVEMVVAGWWLAFAVPLLFIDLAVHRLPDRLTWPAAAGTWLLLGLAALTGADATPWLRAVAAGLGLALFFATTTLLLGARGFGIGDAKLALSAGTLLGWYGWSLPVFGLLLALTLSGLVALGLLVSRRARLSSHLPFGPYLVLGTVGALLLVW
ncbi:prepilin peptidase [Verrucosispora sp. CWR15]|uniref:Prepilin peptidase n=1 Tax=Verrucosispora sioxanthis TaxID=2499994 RepID=A0A6M1L5M2_9ACTN|nr:A24 family peptidase [Verrucosispora sioxanthis]NEE63614.1 prepilin peptidase [Verrucosispora sioxanthis]NGM12724.1 prepilin peptidase [Verrucosispora sioxanthis]